MDALRTGVSMLAPFDPELNDHSHDANIRKSVRVIARMCTLIAAGWRIHQKEHPIAPTEDLHHVANFLYMLRGQRPADWETRAMQTLFVVYAEHDFNASTFAARVTASTMSDIYAAVTSAIGALKGPLHGGANEAAMAMLIDIGSPDRAEDWIRQRLARKEKIMGFGHRVYKKGDSRVPAIRELARAWRAPRADTLGRHLPAPRTCHGRGERPLRQPRPLRRAGPAHAANPQPAEHADLRGRPRQRLVRARRGTARSQPADPAEIAVYGSCAQELE